MPKKTKKGIVVSNKMDKTVVVAVEERHPHPKYGKIQKRTVKFKAHDDKNVCEVGFVVSIEECRRLSKEKAWRVISYDGKPIDIQQGAA